MCSVDALSDLSSQTRRRFGSLGLRVDGWRLYGGTSDAGSLASGRKARRRTAGESPRQSYTLRCGGVAAVPCRAGMIWRARHLRVDAAVGDRQTDGDHVRDRRIRTDRSGSAAAGARGPYAEVLAVMRPYTAASNKARKPAMVMSTSPPNRVRVRMGDGTRRSLRLNIRQAPSGPATHDLRGHDRNLKRAWEGWWRLLHNSAWCKRIDGRRGLIDRSYRHTQ